jgi:putative phosphoribosyl transferase
LTVCGAQPTLRETPIYRIVHSRFITKAYLGGVRAHDCAPGRFRFDIEMLSLRLVAATNWLMSQRDLRDLPVGYFGASTGAAAAVVAAGLRPEVVGAIVSRGGRPDLAGSTLQMVRAPTLLIVGGFDPVVIDLNHDALRRLRCVARLEIVPRAGHLFEEPGALEKVSELACRWFNEHLVARRAEAHAWHQRTG